MRLFAEKQWNFSGDGDLRTFNLGTRGKRGATQTREKPHKQQRVAKGVGNMNRKSFGAGKRDGGKPAGAEQPCGADGVPATAGQDLGAAGEEHANDGGEAKGEAEAVAVGPVTEIELNEYILRNIR